MANRERISRVDTAWLRMDRPTNLMMIVGVMIFDGPIEYARLRSILDTRLLAYPRFRQRVIADASGYYWEDDDDFDLDAHLQLAVLPRAEGKEELERAVAHLVATPLNPNRPLWHFQLVQNYGGGAALIVRIHHCIADGIALIAVLLSMTDDSPETPREPTARPVLPRAGMDDEGIWPRLVGVVDTALENVAKLSGTLLHEVIQNPERISDYARIGAGIASEVIELATMPDDSRTRFKGKPGTAKRVAWSEPMPLSEIKALGSFLGCSVNDLMLSSVAGALRAYLLSKRDSVAGVELRSLVPVNLRSAGSEHQLGNQFGLVALVLPLGEDNPLLRLYEVRKRMADLKNSYQAALTLGLLGLVGTCPKPVQTQILDLLARKATAVVTNVPGPQETLYLAGARLKQQMFWVPQSGDIGMGVSILSYDGGVQFGLVTDKRFVPDPERIVACFHSEFEKILYSVLLEPHLALNDPRELEQRLSISDALPPAQESPAVPHPPPPQASDSKPGSPRIPRRFR